MHFRAIADNLTRGNDVGDGCERVSGQKFLRDRKHQGREELMQKVSEG